METFTDIIFKMDDRHIFSKNASMHHHINFDSWNVNACHLWIRPSPQ